MEIPAIHIFTHDSIGVGEGGPTHQPVEHLASLRAIPGMITLRPADANEIVEAWRVTVELRHTPVALVLSRQPLPTVDRSKYATASGLRKGGYVLADADDGQPELLLLGTGSEVWLCLEDTSQKCPDLNYEGPLARFARLTLTECRLCDPGNRTVGIALRPAGTASRTARMIRPLRRACERKQ
jgi:hypothetical protein